MARPLSRVVSVLSLLIGLPLAAQAQTTVTGTVTSETGTPIQAASVSIPALGVGAITTADGRYTFSVPAGRTGTEVLTARRLGYVPRSVSITLNGGTVTQNISLSTSPTQLSGVVVTALGAAREKSTLGTAQQQLSSEDINQTRSLNVIDQLAGKVAGAQITSPGTPGGSTRIVLRGTNSITGDNTPLFVVDGTLMSKIDRGGDPVGGGWDFGSVLNDINPDDIETMTVLKGPNAAALYGSQAANGVIVITTKKGRNSGGRARTEISSYYDFERPARLPTYQNQYGQGAAGQFSYVNGAGGSGTDGLDQSWGPKLDVAGRNICQFTSPGAGTANCTPTPWVSHPDNVSSFFDTGHDASGSVAVSAGTDRANARLSFTSDNFDSYIPNNYFVKNSVQLSGGVDVSSRLSTSGSLQYVRDDGKNRPCTGYSGTCASILESFVWFGRQVDMDALKNGWTKSGALNGGPAAREFNWNYNYHLNPFWQQNANPEGDNRDRLVGNISATYKLTDWLNGTLRSGTDLYNYAINQDFKPNGGVYGFPNPNYAGGFINTLDYNNQNNTDLIFSANHDIAKSWTVNATAGGTQRKESRRIGQTTVSGLSVPGIYSPSNAAIAPTVVSSVVQRQVNSVYGSAAFTYNGWWTVEGTARNDWSSTLPVKSAACPTCTNSYFYPSVNTSVVLSDAFPSIKTSWMSYLKLRGSIARVGNDAIPYQLQTTYAGVATQFHGLPQFTLSDFIANAALKPEITTSNEVGAEASFLNGRANVDASLYDKRTRNQIFNVDVSPTTGFNSKSINAGEVSNKGIELGLTAIPVQLANGLQWTSTFNYAHNASKVNKLYVNPVTGDSVKTIVINQGFEWYMNVEARLGQPYGSLVGYPFLRDSATGKLITSGGVTLAGPQKILGNIQPNWIGSWGNSVNFRNWTLSGLFDIKRGGDIYSVTNWFGQYAGVLKSTLRGREIDWNDPGIVVQGIDVGSCGAGSHTIRGNQNGKYYATYNCVGGGSANTDTVTAEEYFQSLFPQNEGAVYDGSYVKLRELRVGYDLPARWASRFYANAINVSVTGRNLYMWTKVPNIDPEFSYTTGNLQGIEYGVIPNPRTFGFSVRVTP
jgi:TonB-linked SusC/RagA family outer membrane protein